MKYARVVIAASFLLALSVRAYRAPESYFSGFIAAAGLAYWTRFACVIGGDLAGVVMGLLGAVAATIFVQATNSELHAAAVFFGGLLLNIAEYWSKENKLTTRNLFVTGVVAGLAAATSIATAPYLVGAVAFFFAMTSEVRRAFWVPSTREMKSQVSRVMLLVIIGLLLVAAASWNAQRPFYGMDAAPAFTLAAQALVILWCWHRARLFVASARRFAFFLGGLFLGGVIPAALKISSFRGFRPFPVVNLSAWIGEMPLRLCEVFSVLSPHKLGLAALVGALVVLVGGFLTIRGRNRRVYATSLVVTAVSMTSWTAYYPLYLSLAFAVGLSPRRKVLILGLVPVLVAAIADFAVQY